MYVPLRLGVILLMSNRPVLEENWREGGREKERKRGEKGRRKSERDMCNHVCVESSRQKS